MAASGSDSVESAPTIFPVYFSHEVHDTQISVAVERCQLCLGGKRCFSCTNCVKNGNFVHSSSKNSAQNAKSVHEAGNMDVRFIDKLELWRELKREREEIGKRADGIGDQQVLLEEKKHQVIFARQRNELLKKAIQEARDKLQKEKDALKKLGEENRQRKSKSSRHSDKTKRIVQYTDKSVKQTSTSQSSLDGTVSDLVTLRKQHAQDLVNFIFPITQVQQKSTSESDNHEENTIGLLAEARHTSYVKGRWVYADNGGEHQYHIVHPTLPGNGDYSAYPVWLLSNKHVLSGPESDLQLINPTFNIGAALQYVAQMVNVLALILDVNLPYRVSYGDFGGELEEERFYKMVFRLNSNVLQLCFSQSVDPDKLQAHHTIHNILTALHTQYLGRTGPFQVPAELMQSFEESHHAFAEDEDEISESGDILDGGEIDWEQVSSSLPEADIPQSFYSSTQISRRSSEMTLGSSSSGSIAGNLMSIGSSLWRYTWAPKSSDKK